MWEWIPSRPFSLPSLQEGPGRHGGGVYIAVHERYVASEVTELNSNCEAVWVKLEIYNHKPLYIFSFYRPPSGDVEDLNELDLSIQKITRATNIPNLVIAGDFNLPDINWDNTSVRTPSNYPQCLSSTLIDIVNNNYLTQMVTQPTRGLNTLDLILTSNPGLIEEVMTMSGTSNHHVVKADLHVDARINRKKPR